MIAWLPELLYTAHGFESGLALVCDELGTIAGINRGDQLKDEKKINLPHRAMLPGMVNAHSHAFQRLLRGRTAYRPRAFRGGLLPAQSGGSPTQNSEAGVDSFWT